MNCHQLHATSTSTVGDIKAYRALWRCQRRDRPSSPSSVAKADLWRGHASSAVPNGQPRKLSIVAWHFVSPECEVKKKGQAAYVLSEDRDTCTALDSALSSFPFPYLLSVESVRVSRTSLWSLSASVPRRHCFPFRPLHAAVLSEMREDGRMMAFSLASVAPAPVR